MLCHYWTPGKYTGKSFILHYIENNKFNFIMIIFQVLMDPMVLSILYVWCQLNKDVIVSFWFGTRFKAMYLPWVLFGFNLIISGG